jgi:DNA-binding NtrC family response regulator
MASAPILFVVRSRAMQRAVDIAAAAAATHRPVVIVGEAGTGKDRMARWIHARSPRARAQLCRLDCTWVATAGSAELRALEWSRHPIQTHGGTVVLDGIDRLHKRLRDNAVTSWLRFLTINESVQVIATSRRARSELLDGDGAITELARILDGYQISMPPLRDRRPDIAQLVRERLRELCREHEIPKLRPSADALDALCGYRWPGNVQQLEEILERAVLTAEETGRIELEDLPRDVRGPLERDPDDDDIETLAAVEKRHILTALQACGGNRQETAAALGIGVNTLWRRLKSYGLARERDRVPCEAEADSE